MAMLALTSANLSFLKQALRSTFPNIKSSHLSEGIAAAFGFKSNIALKTNLQTQASRPGTQFHPLKQRAFQERIYDLTGEQISMTLPTEFPTPNWKEFKGKNIPDQNKWFHECQSLQIPFIYISTYRKYADLHWDYISLDKKYDEKLLKDDNGSTLGHKLYDAFCNLSPMHPKAMFQGSALVGTIDKLSFQEARQLADTFFSIIYSEMIKP